MEKHIYVVVQVQVANLRSSTILISPKSPNLSLFQVECCKLVGFGLLKYCEASLPLGSATVLNDLRAEVVWSPDLKITAEQPWSVYGAHTNVQGRFPSSAGCHGSSIVLRNFKPKMTRHDKHDSPGCESLRDVRYLPHRDVFLEVSQWCANHPRRFTQREGVGIVLVVMKMNVNDVSAWRKSPKPVLGELQYPCNAEVT